MDHFWIKAEFDYSVQTLLSPILGKIAQIPVWLLVLCKIVKNRKTGVPGEKTTVEALGYL